MEEFQEPYCQAAGITSRQTVFFDAAEIGAAQAATVSG